MGKDPRGYVEVSQAGYAGVVPIGYGKVPLVGYSEVSRRGFPKRSLEESMPSDRFQDRRYVEERRRSIGIE